MDCCKEYNSELLLKIKKLEEENALLKNELKEINDYNKDIIENNLEIEKDIDELEKINENLDDAIQKQNKFFNDNNIYLEKMKYRLIK